LIKDRDEAMPLTAVTCPPEDDRLAEDRVRVFGQKSLLGLTDTIWSNLEQLETALAATGFQLTGKELVLDGGRKRCFKIAIAKNGVCYSIVAIESKTLCRAEVVVLDSVPDELDYLKDELEDVAYG
jgi:hypothetical protein